jgi:hypothetical protein
LAISVLSLALGAYVIFPRVRKPWERQNRSLAQSLIRRNAFRGVLGSVVIFLITAGVFG